jgi:hypothetical protein
VDELPVVGKPVDTAVLAHGAHPRTIAKGRSAQGQWAEKGACHISILTEAVVVSITGWIGTTNWILDPI